MVAEVVLERRVEPAGVADHQPRQQPAGVVRQRLAGPLQAGPQHARPPAASTAGARPARGPSCTETTAARRSPPRGGSSFPVAATRCPGSSPRHPGSLPSTSAPDATCVPARPVLRPHHLKINSDQVRGRQPRRPAHRPRIITHHQLDPYGIAGLAQPQPAVPPRRHPCRSPGHHAPHPTPSSTATPTHRAAAHRPPPLDARPAGTEPAPQTAPRARARRRRGSSPDRAESTARPARTARRRPRTRPAAGRARRASPGRPTGSGGRSPLRRSHRHQVFQLLVPGVADAVHLAQIADRPEAALGLPGVEDPLGEHRPDARQRVELGEGGGVQVDRAAGAAPPAAAVPAGRRPRGPGDGATPTRISSPSTTLRARLSIATSTPGSAPTGRGQRVGHPGTGPAAAPAPACAPCRPPRPPPPPRTSTRTRLRSPGGAPGRPPCRPGGAEGRRRHRIDLRGRARQARKAATRPPARRPRPAPARRAARGRTPESDPTATTPAATVGPADHRRSPANAGSAATLEACRTRRPLGSTGVPSVPSSPRESNGGSPRGRDGAVDAAPPASTARRASTASPGSTDRSRTATTSSAIFASRTAADGRDLDHPQAHHEWTKGHCG